MRQIKFRGKRDDGLGWAYGSLNTWQDGTCEISHSELNDEMIKSKVDPSTLGQFTGLLDKNGKEIYDGDLLRYEPKDDWDKINFTCYEVFFHDGNANMDYNIGYSIARTHHHGSICGGYIPSFKPKSVSKMIVCGNLHDSPSLTNH